MKEEPNCLKCISKSKIINKIIEGKPVVVCPLLFYYNMVIELHFDDEPCCIGYPSQYQNSSFEPHNDAFAEEQTEEP